jgi:hypothetical protein
VKTYSFIKPDPTLRNNLMAFGYENGLGWYPLIEELFDKITELLDTKYLELKEDFEVLQVKEKWGSLRVYVSTANDEIFDLIDEYEEKSSKICENCGKPGIIKEINGWWTCTCAECEKIK